MQGRSLQIDNLLLATTTPLLLTQPILGVFNSTARTRDPCSQANSVTPHPLVTFHMNRL